jgi:hypothetical protein
LSNANHIGHLSCAGHANNAGRASHEGQVGHAAHVGHTGHADYMGHTKHFIQVIQSIHGYHGSHFRKRLKSNNRDASWETLEIKEFQQQSKSKCMFLFLTC